MTDSKVNEKVRFFSNALRERLGDNVRQIILFGSRARGDYWEGSDYDFVVIVNQKDQHVKDIVGDVGVAFLDRYDELAASLLYNKKEWEERKQFPIGINVRREGVVL